MAAAIVTNAIKRNVDVGNVLPYPRVPLQYVTGGAEARVGVPKQSNRIDPLRFSEVDDDLLPLRLPPCKIDRVAHPRPAYITIDQMLAAARSVC